MKRAILLTGILLVIILKISGQNNLNPNIYFQDMNYYNPSSIPMDTSATYFVSAYTKYKFVENDPEIWNKRASVFLNHIGQLPNKRSFYSIAYLNDDYSYFNRNGLYLGYIHRIKWGKTSSLSFSGRAIFNFDVIQWNKLKLPVSESGYSLKMRPDIDLGMEYKVRGFVLGASSQNVIASSLKTEGAVLIRNKRAYVFNTSYLFNIGRHFKVAPFALVRWERAWASDAGVYASAFNFVKVSYAFRVKELRHIYAIDCRTLKNLFLGVSFDTSRLIPDNNLDVVLKYQF